MSILGEAQPREREDLAFSGQMHNTVDLVDRDVSGTIADAVADTEASSSPGKKTKRYVLKASKDSPRKRRTHPCRELFNAIAIYAVCILLPGLFGIFVRWYERFCSINRRGGEVIHGIGTNHNNGYDLLSFLYGNEQESISALARNAVDVLWSPYTFTGIGGTGNFDPDTFHLLGLPQSMYMFLKRHISVYVSNHAMSDVQFIVALSIALSVLRVTLVYLLVPRYLAPRRLTALVHSKSTHLLSSWEYQFAKKSEQCADGDKGWGGYILTHLNNLWIETGDSFRRSLGHEDQTPYDNLDAAQALRLFTAPRYATAIFRLLFCLLSCSWAYIKFSQSGMFRVRESTVKRDDNLVSPMILPTMFIFP